MRRQTYNAALVFAARLAFYGLASVICSDAAMAEACGKEHAPPAASSLSKYTSSRYYGSSSSSSRASARKTAAMTAIQTCMQRNAALMGSGDSANGFDASLEAHTRLVVAYELLELYRTIIGGAVSSGSVIPPSPESTMKAAARTLLAQSIIRLPEAIAQVVSSAGKEATAGREGLGAVLVLGGDGGRVLAVGVRVKLSDGIVASGATSSGAVVVEYTDGSSDVTVVLDGSSDQIIVPVDNVEVIAGVAAPPAHIVLNLLSADGATGTLDAINAALGALAGHLDAGRLSAPLQYLLSLLQSRLIRLVYGMVTDSQLVLERVAAHASLLTSLEVCGRSLLQ